MPIGWQVLVVALWIVVLVQMALILVLYHQVGTVLLGKRPARERDGLPLLAQAPAWAATDQRGRYVSSEDLAGRPLVIVFADPDCRPCQRLMPELQSFADVHRDEIGVVIAGVDDELANREMAERYGLDVPVIAQTERDLTNAFRVVVSPFMFVVDADGRIREKGVVATRRQIEQKVAALQQEFVNEEVV